MSKIYKSSKPTASSVYVDELLTQISIAWMQNPAHYVNRITPAVPVMLQSSKYATKSKSDFLRSDVQRLAPGGSAARSGYGVTTDSQYSCDVWALAHAIDDQLRANWRVSGDPDESGAKYLAQQMMIKMESLWSSAYFGASIWTGGDVTVAAGDKWDVATSDPLEQIMGAKVAILNSTGFEPNKMVVSPWAHKALRVHPLIRSHFQYTTASQITEGMLADYFEVDVYAVAKAVQETAKEGGTSSVSFINGKHALLVFCEDSPMQDSPSGMYKFAWEGLIPQSGEGVAVFRYPEPPHNDVIEINAAFDFQVPNSELGYFFGSVVS